MTVQTKQQVIVPPPGSQEDPLSYAERLGAWYSAQTTEVYRKKLGIYFTPAPIARYMGRLCRNGTGHFVRLLDPAAGTGVLGCAASLSLAAATNPPRHIELVCYEVDPEIGTSLEASLQHLERWLAARKIKFRYRIEATDFLLANAPALQPGLLASGTSRFDAVICNPPYFKIPKSDPRARACAPVVHGQPNIYGLFMAVAASLLREGGRSVFITPRSFASGPYFQRFREFFFKDLRPTDVHVFESRTDAFSDVLQETAITAGTRLCGWSKNSGLQRIRLSSSTGASDIESAAVRTLPLRDVLRGDCSHRVLSFPATREHDRVRVLVRKWVGSLHAYGWEVSTGPVVAFRAKRFLHDRSTRQTVPLLWLQNVAPMVVRWPATSRKAQYILNTSDAASIVVPNRNYVLLRRFSAKEEERRLTAAPHLHKAFKHDKIGLENHLNFIHKPGGQLSADEVYGLAALLSSQLFDTYFRISSGNTQVSATELRALPLPPLQAISRIGKRVRADFLRLETIVGEELGYGG
ncbi:MAG: Eco57I restriction-modification methylase domain-containing protein [Betaproteobacteria bacterium]